MFTPMKRTFPWVFVIMAAIVFMIPPGVLPCWLIKEGSPTHLHYYMGTQTILTMPCPFSSIETNSSPALLNTQPSTELLLAHLSDGILFLYEQSQPLINTGWLYPPDFPPPRSPFSLS